MGTRTIEHYKTEQLNQYFTPENLITVNYLMHENLHKQPQVHLITKTIINATTMCF